MKFEVFDRDAAAASREPVTQGPLVRVYEHGRLLFNAPAWQFVTMHGPLGVPAEVVLLFDAETRTVGVQPIGGQEMPTGARWACVVMRSVQWPRSVAAREFVEHYRIGVGVYQAWLLRGPGPRMVTFEVGSPTPEHPLLAPLGDAGLPVAAAPAVVGPGGPA